MANKRVYDEVDGLSFADGGDGIDVAGNTSLTTEQSYADNLDSVADGIDGPATVAEAGQQVRFTIVSTDVLKGIPLLIGTLTAAEWYGHESGAATYGKATLVGPKCLSMRFAASKGQFATMTIDGECQFPAAASEFDDVEGWLAAQSAPELSYPAMQWESQGAVHGSVVALHMQDLSFAIQGRVLRDRDGGDKGMTVIDVAGYTIGSVEMTIRDATQQTGPPTHDVATALMLNGIANLVAPFVGVGAAADYILTIRNVKWRSKRKAAGRDWTGHTLSGVVQWRDTVDPYTVRTLNHATPAERIINFAAA